MQRGAREALRALQQKVRQEQQQLRQTQTGPGEGGRAGGDGTDLGGAGPGGRGGGAEVSNAASDGPFGSRNATSLRGGITAHSLELLERELEGRQTGAPLVYDFRNGSWATDDVERRLV